MKTILIAASALAFAGPLTAQTTTAPAPPPVATSDATAVPADPVPAQSTGAATAAPAVATPADPKTIIANEFPTYDKDGSGALSQSEFAAWMIALKTKTDPKPMTAAQSTAYTSGAFKTADKDASKTVTLTELQAYLTAGA